MSRKKRHEKPEETKEEKKDAAAYYKLKKEAIEDLVTADSSNSPEVSEEELRKYTGKKKFAIPDWLKVIFVKFWFAAAVCYFFFWGLGGKLNGLPDQLFVLGMALGIITDLLTNNALRFMAKTEGGNDRYIMVSRKRYSSFVLNILYAYVVIFLVFTIYNMINIAVMAAKGGSETLPLGVEPVLFGLFCMGADMMLVGMRNLAKKIVSEAKEKGHGLSHT